MEDIDARNNDGDTPLHYGFKRGMECKTLEVLLGCGANVHIRNNKGRSLLHEAAKYSDIGIRAIELLIEHGASVKSLDDDGFSILHDIFTNPVLTTEMLHLLLRNGAIPDYRNSKNKPPLAYVPKSHLSGRDKEYATKLLIQYTVLNKFNGSQIASNGLFENEEILSLNFCQDLQRHNELVRVRDQCISEVRQMTEYILEDNFTLFHFIHHHYYNFINLKDKNEVFIEQIMKWIIKNEYSSFRDVIISCLDHSNIDKFVSKLAIYTFKDVSNDFVKINSDCVKVIANFLKIADTINLICVFYKF